MPALTADHVPLAGWWHRAGAAVLDGLMVGLVTLLLSLPFFQNFADTFGTFFNDSLDAASRGLPPPPQPDPSRVFTRTDTLGIATIAFLGGMAWNVLFLRFRSATPGKLITGLRVVPVDQGRSTERLSWQTAVVRSVIWVAPAAVDLLYLLRLVDVIVPLTNPRKQSLHDLAAKTQVVVRRG